MDDPLTVLEEGGGLLDAAEVAASVQERRVAGAPYLSVGLGRGDVADALRRGRCVAHRSGDGEADMGTLKAITARPLPVTAVE